LELKEFRELSDAVEYDRQNQLSYQRHLVFCQLTAAGVKQLTPERLLPLPLIDGNADRLREQRDSIMDYAKLLKKKRTENGRT